jgi:hypothetical protein
VDFLNAAVNPSMTRHRRRENDTRAKRCSGSSPSASGVAAGAPDDDRRLVAEDDAADPARTARARFAAGHAGQA